MPLTRALGVGLAIAALAGAPQEPKPAPLPKCPPDWSLEVVAEVPRINHPSVVCCAPDGRVFVGEDPMDMAGPADRPHDRIVCFHPDGRRTVFADKLYAVFGMQYIDGKLYVHHTPKFSVFEDGGDEARGRIDLIECTHPDPSNGGSLNDHIPSNFKLAMDGYLYVSTGDKGIFGAVGRDGSKIELRGGGIFRMRPEGTELEVYCTGTRNHLDVALDDDDELFTYDNTDDGLGWWTRVTHMIDGGFYGYPWDYKPPRPYALRPMADYGGGSPTGALAYNEDALPEEYRGNLFFCEWGRSQLLRLRLERAGATYRIASREDFLRDGPGDFRPCGIAVSPDGLSFYISDWNFPGWRQNSKAGRLLKLTYTGKSRAAPKPAWFGAAKCGAKIDDLVGALAHPAQSVRLFAQRRLVERGAAEPLLRLLADGGANVRARRHAIWTLDALRAGQREILAAVDDPAVRHQAIRQLGTRRVKEAAAPLAKLLREADPALRLRAATALGRIGDAAAVPALLDALDEPDLFARFAVFTALNRIGRADRRAWPEIVKGLRRPAIAEAASYALRDTYDDALVAALAEAKELRLLAELHRKPPSWDGKWWSIQPAAQPRPAKTFEWSGTAAVLAALRAGLEDPDLRVAAVDGLRTAGDKASAPALCDLFRRDDRADVRRAIIGVLGDFKDAGFAAIFGEAARTDAAAAVAAAERIGLADALSELSAKSAESATIALALGALGRLKSSSPVIARLLSHADAAVRLAAVRACAQAEPLVPLLADASVEVRRAAVKALGTLRHKAAVPQLLRAYLDAGTREEAIGALAQMPDVRALDAYLDGLGGKNAALRESCAKAVKSVQAEAFPLIESKVEATLLKPEVVAELQRICSSYEPLREWEILGPFPNPTTVDVPDLDREHKDIEGRPAKWKKVNSIESHGQVNFCTEFDPDQNTTAFARAEWTADAAYEAEFVIGSDDGVSVWLNGAKIFEDLGDRGWGPDQFRVRASVRGGKNVLVARVLQRGGDWMVSVARSGHRRGKLFEAAVRQLNPKDYEEHALRNPGDAARGKALVVDPKTSACFKCHSIHGEGSHVGPDLGGIGSRYDRKQLVESVLYPSKQIHDGYRRTIVITKSGDFFAGSVRGESAEDLTLMEPDGTERRIRKSDIEERRLSDISVMPDGLNTGMTLEEFADLISYLESLKE